MLTPNHSRMKNIPIRKLDVRQKELDVSESFNIRAVQDLLSGRDMVQDLHRHDFFYVLALEKGKGTHAIDFTSYKISGYSVFFLRPGQVHQLKLKAGSAGYLMEFTADFIILVAKTQVICCERQAIRIFAN
jgi:AraC family transcriptional activator of pobA